VDEDVRRREPVPHAVCEAHRADAVLGPELGGDPCAQRFIAPAHHDDGRAACRRKRDTRGACDVAHAPAASGDQHDRIAFGQTERFPCLAPVARLEELRIGQAAHMGDLRGDAGARSHFRRRLRVDDEMKVELRVCPEPQRRQVGDRRHQRNVDLSSPMHTAENLIGAGIGGDDHVRRRVVDHGCQARTRQPVGGAAGSPTDRRYPGHGEVGDIERAREAGERALGPFADDAVDHGPGGSEAVDDRDTRLGPAATDLIGEQARREVVTLTDVCGEDEDAGRVDAHAREAYAAPPVPELSFRGPDLFSAAVTPVPIAPIDG